ncbi:MAG: three-Cys-motif partner protein TcmP, partial [Terriglobia bacterium]
MDIAMEGEGGPWTTKKLTAVRQYLVGYQDVMLNQKWVETVYIDAFCGSGEVKLRGARDFTEGSALQAIGLKRPFHEYHLIEKSKASLQRLERQVQERHRDRVPRVKFHPGDVNALLPPIIASLGGHNRAVIFSDPKGMQLDWKTVEAIASKTCCDFWLLVPTGMGLARVATKNPRQMPPSWRQRVNRFLGEDDWIDRWYAPTGQTDLFGDQEEFSRTATLQRMTADFQNRLRSVFPCVADNVLHLKNGNLVL